MCKVYKCSLRSDKNKIFACRIMKLTSDPLILDRIKT